MQRETIVTEAPVSDTSHPIWRSLKQAMRRFTKRGVVWELVEHPPVGEFDLMSFVNRATGATPPSRDELLARAKRSRSDPTRLMRAVYSDRPIPTGGGREAPNYLSTMTHD